MLIYMSVISGLNWALLLANQGDSLLNILSIFLSHILFYFIYAGALFQVLFLRSKFIILYLGRMSV